MIHLTLQDLRHDLPNFGFSVLGLAVLIFAFLLLIPLSLEITRFDEAAGVPQNLILVERDALQPEESRIAPDLADRVSAILGDRLDRIDPLVFRILRIEDHPTQLRGVAVESWERTFRLRLLEGTWPSSPSEVVIGQLAATEAGWRTGSEIRVYGQNFRVAGIADGPGTKSQTIWMPYAAALDLFGPRRGAQLLVAHLDPTADPIASRQELEDGLHSTGLEYDVYFEDALLREYFAALNDLRGLSILTAVIAIAAVSLGSHNLAWLAADERTRLIGILRTVGFGRQAVGRYLLLRAGGIAIAAYLLALAAAVVYLRFGVTPESLRIAGLQNGLALSPPLAGLGLLLACAASLAGTWLSAAGILRASPTALLGRGPGGSFA